MPGRISCPILVGRQHELARISAFLTEEGARPPSMLLVAGEAGIGKSRLLSAALTDARRQGLAVLVGSCVPLAGRTLPFGPIMEALRPHPAAAEEPIARELRARLDPGALGLVADDPAVGARASDRARLFEGLLTALERGAEDRRIVLAIEDLHWSDAATRDLLAFLIPNLAVREVAVITTLRTDEADAARLVRPMLGELDRLGRLARLDLSRLEPEGVANMVGGILGRDPPQELVSAVRRRSGGNPLFIEELVASGAAEGRLPPSLSEMLLARLGTLPEPSQELLRYMAVIGDRVSEALLVAASGVTVREVRSHLRAAITAHVIRMGDDDDELEFRHALVREAIYADLLVAERRELHERVAAALEADTGERLLSGAGRRVAIALHWDAGARPDRALPALVAAAEAAVAAHAFGDALDLYRRSGELWDDVTAAVRAESGTDRASLEERMGQVASLAGDWEEAALAARRAIALRDPDHEAARVGVLFQRLSEYLWHSGSEPEALAMAARAAQLVPVSGAPFERVRALVSWASALAVVSRYAEAAAPAAEAAALATALGDPGSISLALAMRGTVRANLDDLVAGVADMEASVAAALMTDDPDDQLMAFVNGSWVIGAIAGDPARGLDIIAEWEALQRRQGLERTRGAWVDGFAGELRWRGGEWSKADAVLTAALDRVSYGPVRLEILINASMLRTWQGRLMEAENLLAEVDTLVAGFVGQQFVGRAGVARVAHDVWRGDPDAGTRHLADARSRLLEPEDPLWTRQLYALGVRACADRADKLRRASGAAELARLRDTAEELVHLGRYDVVPNLTARLPETRAWAAQGRAELQRLIDPPNAEAWRDVAEQWEAVGLQVEEVYARWREGEAWLRLGDRASALKALNLGHRLASQIGAGAVVAAIAETGRRARLRLKAVGPGVITEPSIARRRRLTERELEVLALVARGLSNKEIASTLFISEKTAGVHVSSILGKLDVSSRGQAAILALREQLI